MDNYEVNVLTRKGGWKKLPQEVVTNTEELNSNETEDIKEYQSNYSDNLNIKVTVKEDMQLAQLIIKNTIKS